ncbi:MAG: glycerate kinase [Dehalococcoidia bacterium]|nr:glycerate kinase [Dehalococcoidia bacterium]
MKIVCAPQAFKGSLKALDAALAMRDGILAVFPDADAVIAPMADGGDDTLDVLVTATSGRYFSTRVTGPLGAPVEAQWGVLGDARTAVIEMACASGLRLLPLRRRDPRVTTTYGTGELLRAALDAGYRRIVVGVGGSATVDGGAGAASALGARFLGARGVPLPPGGAALARLHSIDLSGVDPRTRAAEIIVACDVNMTLGGEEGAWLFAAQKGASPAVAAELRAALEHFARVVERSLGISLATLPRGGPAGGLSGGLHAFAAARLVQGADLVLQLTRLERHFAGADLVLIGEGRMDATSFHGKGPSVLAAHAHAAGIPVAAVVGQLGDNMPALAAWGIRDIASLLDLAPSEAAAESRAAAYITQATIALLRRL